MRYSAQSREIPPSRVAVAMSGGLDSSMAAALLVEQGHDCFGIMMRLWSEVAPGAPSTNKCCSLESVDVARQVADQLDIPFYLINVERTFKRAVVDPFIADFNDGLTPNPCLNCNRHIRFTHLLEYALGLEAEYLATGHHARILRGPDGTARLCRATDRGKDQSYVLSGLSQTQLARSLFPVGDYAKDTLRTMARDRGLPVADKRESMDLCFVADDDYRRFLEDWSASPAGPGPILSPDGETIGEHRGLFHYTIGQRRGLGLTHGSAIPLYVTEKDAHRNALVVGPRADLATHGFHLTQPNWNQGHPPTAEETLTCQTRYRGVDRPCRVETVTAETLRVFLDEPQDGVAPGQAAAFYAGDMCLGGGIIAP